jgi:peptidoglycan/xylan/chitin deacetylase (PgdA/CDA1 family)
MVLLFRVLQHFLPKVLFIGKPSGYYLTIDDGPSEHTTDILDILDRYGVKACFFCIGQNVVNYPNAYQEIVRRGHQVGLHSMEHKSLWQINFKAAKDDFRKSEVIIRSKMYRPPYGRMTPRFFLFLMRSDYKIIFWNRLTEDWKKLQNPEKTMEKKMENAPLGSIFVFHDNEKSKNNIKTMLPVFLQTIQNQKISLEKLQF